MLKLMVKNVPYAGYKYVYELLFNIQSMTVHMVLNYRALVAVVAVKNTHK